MNVTGKTKIFRKDFDGKPAYSRAISSRKFENGKQGDWMKPVYESVQFPKGTQIADGTIVNVTKAFEGTYETRSGEVKRKLVVQEYEVEGEIAADKAHDSEFTALINDDIPF